MREEQRASDLKELHVHFEANLSTRAWHVFQKFRKNCLEYKKISQLVQIRNQTCNFFGC